LKNLRYLTLSHNSFRGLLNLIDHYIIFDFIGEIPIDYSRLSSLSSLDLSFNEHLKGEIPFNLIKTIDKRFQSKEETDSSNIHTQRTNISKNINK